MKLKPLLLSAALVVALSVEAAEFREVRLEEDGNRLTIVQSDGATFAAPKFEDQDSFEKPGISSSRRYAGWLALFPNQGASYSQPLYLVVLDAAKRMHRFSGDFGMVFGWCFAKETDAVIYRFQFPHGMTPIGFEMRRAKDGKLLHRFRLEPIKRDGDESRVIRTKAPEWTRCAQQSAATE
jgi:hypothetical protein